MREVYDVQFYPPFGFNECTVFHNRSNVFELHGIENECVIATLDDDFAEKLLDFIYEYGNLVTIIASNNSEVVS